MDQLVIDDTPLLQEARRQLTLGRRCSYCRQYPGHGEVCPERGRPVYARSKPCKVYDEMTAAEYAELKEKVKAQRKAYREANKEKLKAQQKMLELLKAADPDLYRQLTEEVRA